MSINAVSAKPFAPSLDTSAPGQLSNAPAELASLYSPPNQANADVGEAIAMMVIDAAFSQRKTARDANAKAEITMADMQKHEIEKMHEAADERFAAAKTEAYFQIGSGIASGAGVFMSHSSPNVCKGWLKATGEALKTSIGEVGKGTGTLLAAGMKHTAEYADAAAKESEHSASHAKTVADDWADDAKAAQDTIRKALDFLKDYQSAQNQAQSAALHRA